jgi:hypothetical protein
MFKCWLNVIWRDVPVFGRDPAGRLARDAGGQPLVEKRSDQLAAWTIGLVLFDELRAKDLAYRGIASRDFRITRRGVGFRTRYTIDPADPDAGPVPMTEADQELAASKFDFSAEVTPPPYETWAAYVRSERT